MRIWSISMEWSFWNQRSLIFCFTAQKMKFSIKAFFDMNSQNRWKQRIWSHLVRKFLLENFIFCTVFVFNLLFVISTIFLKYLGGSRLELFNKKDVLKNFAKCTVSESLFDKVVGLRLGMLKIFSLKLFVYQLEFRIVVSSFSPNLWKVRVCVQVRVTDM